METRTDIHRFRCSSHPTAFMYSCYHCTTNLAEFAIETKKDLDHAFERVGKLELVVARLILETKE